jgi:hypothetical protein
MSNEYTWRQAIEKVLSDAPNGQCYTDIDIANAIVKQGLMSTLELGASPPSTARFELLTAIEKEGERCPFQKVGKCQFVWKGKGGFPTPTDPAELQNGIFTSYGIRWRKDAIQWTSKPRIWGVSRIWPDPWSVDFHDQFGIYLLYDGPEVIYVGRAITGHLGQRLKAHTTDRLSTRWDGFSWFGLCEVNQFGTLSDLPNRYCGEAVIQAMEAILIEAVKPHQNRKQGDYLLQFEYRQDTRPEPIPSEQQRSEQWSRRYPVKNDYEPEVIQ